MGKGIVTVGVLTTKLTSDHLRCTPDQIRSTTKTPSPLSLAVSRTPRSRNGCAESAPGCLLLALKCILKPGFWNYTRLRTGDSRLTMNVHACQEPSQVYPEKLFEDALTLVIQAALKDNASSLIVPKFGLDLAVFMASSTGTRAVFIEAKSYREQRAGGVGFGTGNAGLQVELLLAGPDQLAILNRHVRWAFVNAMLLPGAPRYALLTCSEARTAAMGTVARDKQNNFKMSAITAHLSTWPIFCESLLSFLSGSGT